MAAKCVRIEGSPRNERDHAITPPHCNCQTRLIYGPGVSRCHGTRSSRSSMSVPEAGVGAGLVATFAQSSGSTLTMEAPSLLPTQKEMGVVELSTNTRRMLVERG